MSFVLDLFDTHEIPIVLAECHRVLTFSGKICVIALVREERLNIVQEIYESLHNLVPALIDCRPIFLEDTIESDGFVTQ